MHIYKFRCTNCGHEFTMLLSLKEGEFQEIACPKCGAAKPELLLTPAELFQRFSVYSFEFPRLATFLSKVEEVENILMVSDGESISIWTIPSRLDEEIEEKIYREELNTIKHFQDYYFDFHIVDRSELPDLIKAGAKIIYSSSSLQTV